MSIVEFENEIEKIVMDSAENAVKESAIWVECLKKDKDLNLKKALAAVRDVNSAIDFLAHPNEKNEYFDFLRYHVVCDHNGGVKIIQGQVKD